MSQPCRTVYVRPRRGDRDVKLGEHGKPFPVYKESVITRRSKYEWLKGSQVYLQRSPDGKVWGI